MTAKRSPVLTAILWVCQVLAAAAFLYAGSAKLTGDPAMVRVFDTIGFGQWFRFVTGGIEVVCGTMLLVPSVAAGAAVVLACVMFGALIAHFTVVPAPPVLPIILLIMVSIVFWVRRPRMFRASAT